MWDEQDGFFYDVLRLPDGRSERLKVRSMVGLLPFCAVTIFEGKLADKVPRRLARRCAGISMSGQKLTAFIHSPVKPGPPARAIPGVDPE